MSKTQLVIVERSVFATQTQRKKKRTVETQLLFEKVKRSLEKYQSIMEECTILDSELDRDIERVSDALQSDSELAKVAAASAAVGTVTGVGVTGGALAAGMATVDVVVGAVATGGGFGVAAPTIVAMTSLAAVFGWVAVGLLAGGLLAGGIFAAWYYGTGQHKKVTPEPAIELTPASGADPLHLSDAFLKKEELLDAGAEALKEVRQGLNKLLQKNPSSEAKAHILNIREEIKVRGTLHQELSSSMKGFISAFDAETSLLSESLSEAKTQLRTANSEKKELTAKNQRLLAEKQDSDSKNTAKYKRLEKKCKEFKKKYKLMKKKTQELTENENHLQEEIELLGNQLTEGAGNFAPGV